MKRRTDYGKNRTLFFRNFNIGKKWGYFSLTYNTMSPKIGASICPPQRLSSVSSAIGDYEMGFHAQLFSVYLNVVMRWYGRENDV
jgi:hypothetical protein